MTDENAGEVEVKPDPYAGIEIETSEAVEAPPAAEPKDKAQTPETVEGDNGSEKKSREARARERNRLEIEQRDKRIAELEALVKPPEAKQPNADTDKEPQIGDYTDVLEYVEAKAEWRMRQALKADKEAQKQENERVKTETEWKQKTDAYDERLKPVIEAVPDLPERIQQIYDQGLVSDTLEKAVIDSPMGELVTVHLLNNPSDLQALQGMNEVQTAKAIGMIEAHIKSQMSQPVAASKKTNAAAPINPIGKKASTSTKSPEDMSQKDWDAYSAKLSAGR